MTDDVFYKTRIYTDVQGLKQLQYQGDLTTAKKEISAQFEALMMQMVFRSMREAVKPFSSGLLSNNQMDFYQDMFDKQLSLMLSNAHLGFAEMIEKNIDQMAHKPVDQTLMLPAINSKITLEAQAHLDRHREQLNVKTMNVSTAKEDNHFSSPEEFIKKLWRTARRAASFIGAAPEILLAQAALETNWGRNVLLHEQGGSSHNLFNIKAGLGWNNKTAEINTIEQKEGVLVKEKAKFRSYNSYLESFLDYVKFLKSNSRYGEALSKASDPKKFIESLHQAGYATDPNYADKVLKIFSSKLFQTMVAKVKNI